MTRTAVHHEPEARTPSKYTARRSVYDALTSDLGVDRRDPQDNNYLVLDLEGLLHVRHVDRFVDALLSWKESIRPEDRDKKLANMRALVDKARREK